MKYSLQWPSLRMLIWMVARRSGDKSGKNQLSVGPRNRDVSEAEKDSVENQKIIVAQITTGPQLRKTDLASIRASLELKSIGIPLMLYVELNRQTFLPGRLSPLVLNLVGRRPVLIAQENS